MIMNRIKEAAIIAIGIVGLGMCIKSGMSDFINKDRRVTVKGLSEREVEADKVTWPIQTKELGDNLPQLYDRINETTGKVKAFLRQNGISEGEISVGAPVVIDLNAEQYGSDRHKYRYNITSTITVPEDKAEDDGRGDTQCRENGATVCREQQQSSG